MVVQGQHHAVAGQRSAGFRPGNGAFHPLSAHVIFRQLDGFRPVNDLRAQRLGLAETARVGKRAVVDHGGILHAVVRLGHALQRTLFLRSLLIEYAAGNGHAQAFLHHCILGQRDLAR